MLATKEDTVIDMLPIMATNMVYPMPIAKWLYIKQRRVWIVRNVKCKSFTNMPFASSTSTTYGIINNEAKAKPKLLLAISSEVQN